MFWFALLLAQTAVTPQIERGEALFFDATKGCASCHALKGRGTAVGPDLKSIGGLAPPAIAVATRSTMTLYAQNVKLKSKESFPAMPGAKDEKGRPFRCMTYRGHRRSCARLTELKLNR
jgi:mono/diheme cytochrome c family protein